MVGYSTRSSYDLYIWLSMDRLLPIDYRLCIPEIELKPGLNLFLYYHHMMIVNQAETQQLVLAFSLC